MRKTKTVTLLLAATLVAPSAALAHGGGQNHDGDHGRAGGQYRSSGGSHGSGAQSRGFGAQNQNHGRNDDAKRHSKVQVKMAREVRSEDNHQDKVKDQDASTPTPAPTATPAAPVRIVGGFQLRGTVGSVANGTIVVNGQAITVDPDKTHIKNGPLAAGQRVKVDGYLKSDGTFVAKEITVQAGATASPEPSASPTAEPTATRALRDTRLSADVRAALEQIAGATLVRPR